MARPVRRGLWIALFATFNLILWAVVAVAVSVIAGDRLDLGLETTLRRYQATAVVAWQRGLGTPQGPTEAVGSQEAVGRALPDGTPSPQTSAGRNSGSEHNTPSVSASTVTLSMSPTPIGGGATTAGAGPPLPGLVDQPLVMADPSFTTFEGFDAEMGRSAVGRAVQIRYEESSLNREIQLLLASSPDLPYHDVHVDLLAGRVMAAGSINVLGLNVGAEVRGRVVAENCRPSLEIESVSLGGVLTPAFVRDGVTEQLVQVMQWYPADYALCLDEIVLENNSVTVYGHRR